MTEIDLLEVALTGEHEVSGKPGATERNDLIGIWSGQTEFAALSQVCAVDVRHYCGVLVIEERVPGFHRGAGGRSSPR